ncbi:MAG: response regulator, partial [Methylobacter sp.]
MNSLNILLIEDETNAQLLEEILVTQGYSVTRIVTSGPNMPSLAKSSKADLVVFNIDSPRKYFSYIHSLSRNQPL